MHDLHLAALPAGTEFEGYRLLGVLGAGGFGVTYLAEEIALSREHSRRVAIKEFIPASIAARVSGSREVRSLRPQDGQAYRQLLDRFLREAETLARFDHPNIVPVLRYFERHGTAYIVMKFVAGESLGAVLKRRQRLSEAEVRWFLPGLLDGMAEVHKRNFLHRDVKPDNILLRDDGAAMLIDFGAARIAAAEVSEMTRTAVISEGYAPYEQYDTHGRQGPWTDLYGLGATLYRALTGAAPVKSPDRLIAKVRGQPDPLVPAGTRAGEKLSDAMETAIARSLALMEPERPQSVEEFRALIGVGAVPAAQSFAIQSVDPVAERAAAQTGTTVDRALSAGAAIGAPLPSSAPPPRSRPRGGARRAWGWIAVASLLVVMVAGPGLDYWRSIMTPGSQEAASPDSAVRKEKAGTSDDERRRSDTPKPTAPPATETPARPGSAAPGGAHTCSAMPKALEGAFADAADCTLVERTLRQALATAESGTVTRWTNTRSQVSGTIKIGGTESRDGAVCRKVELAVTRGGDTKRAETVACLKEGRWVLME
jgi:serine/threonine protein kinase/surface antigen